MVIYWGVMEERREGVSRSLRHRGGLERRKVRRGRKEGGRRVGKGCRDERDRV
jgi:hypothetical protein